MDSNSLLFYILALVIIISSSSVILLPNPIYSALSLAGTMIGLGFMYMLLNAYFIAGVQMIVYAGAVMVLFVIVVMLFDLQKDSSDRPVGQLSKGIKVLCAAILAGIIAFAIRHSIATLATTAAVPAPSEQIYDVKLLAVKLFTQYVFAFEALGVLMLIIAIGVVAVSRAKGGTHAKH